MDVLEEIEKQIKHLDRQAKTAERYRKNKDRERRTSAELLALRVRDLDDLANDADRQLAEHKTRLEAAIAEQRKLEAKIEESRDRQGECGDAFNEVQGRFYKVGSEIARLEQSIEHAHELRERQEKDLEQAVNGAREIREHIDKDKTEIAQLELTLNELVPGLEQARQSERSSSASLQQAEDALAEWQNQWDDCSSRFNEARQSRNVEQTRAEQIESRIQGLSERRQKLDEAQSEVSSDELQANFDDLTEQEQRKRQARDEFDRHLTDITEKIRKLREQDQKLNRLVDERRAALQAGQGKYASLEALQKAALGEGDEGVQDWLESTGLGDNRKVAQTLDVADGWERAIETVLGDYLQAICVSDLTPVTESIGKLQKGNVTILQEHSSKTEVDDTSTLAAKVDGAPDSIQRMLARVQVADSMGSALSIRDMLDDEDSVITADGVWLGKNWLRVSRDKDSKAGILSREHDMRRVKTENRELQARFESARKLVQDGRMRLNQLEERRESVQSDAANLLGEYAETKAALDASKYRMDQTRARQSAITEETGEIDNQKV